MIRPTTNVVLKLRYLSSEYNLIKKRVDDLFEATRRYQFLQIQAGTGLGKSFVNTVLSAEYALKLDGLIVIVSSRNTINSQVSKEAPEYYGKHFSDHEKIQWLTSHTYRGYGKKKQAIDKNTRGIVVASINELEHMLDRGLPVKLIIIDESHEATLAAYRIQYLTCLEKIKEVGVPTVLVTATVPVIDIYENLGDILRFTPENNSYQPRVKEYLVRGLPRRKALINFITDNCVTHRVVYLYNNVNSIRRMRKDLQQKGIKCLVIKSDAHDDGSLLCLNEKNEWKTFTKSSLMGDVQVILGTNSIAAGLNFNDVDKPWLFLSRLNETSVTDSIQFIGRARKQGTHELDYDVLSYVFTPFTITKHPDGTIESDKNLIPDDFKVLKVNFFRHVAEDLVKQGLSAIAGLKERGSTKNKVNGIDGLKRFNLYSHFVQDTKTEIVNGRSRDLISWRPLEGTAQRLALHLLDKWLMQTPQLWYMVKHDYLFFDEKGVLCENSEKTFDLDTVFKTPFGNDVDSEAVVRARSRAIRTVTKVIKDLNRVRARSQLSNTAVYKSREQFEDGLTQEELDLAIYENFCEVVTENEIRQRLLELLEIVPTMTVGELIPFIQITERCTTLMREMLLLHQQLRKVKNGLDLMEVKNEEAAVGFFHLIDESLDYFSDGEHMTLKVIEDHVGNIQMCVHDDIKDDVGISLLGTDIKRKSGIKTEYFYSVQDLMKWLRYMYDFQQVNLDEVKTARKQRAKGNKTVPVPTGLYQLVPRPITTDIHTKFIDPCAEMSAYVDGLTRDQELTDEHTASVLKKLEDKKLKAEEKKIKRRKDPALKEKERIERLAERKRKQAEREKAKRAAKKLERQQTLLAA
ncbi:DEAD/DEAH box helicase family protein [Vibrio vulnificus]